MLKQKTQKEIELAPGQFKDEKTGIIFEKVTINLPVNVVDYYRMLAHFNNTYEPVSYTHLTLPTNREV